jgi:ferric-dicitrate binding protein FerR (iron transport regulator)
VHLRLFALTLLCLPDLACKAVPHNDCFASQSDRQALETKLAASEQRGRELQQALSLSEQLCGRLKKEVQKLKQALDAQARRTEQWVLPASVLLWATCSVLHLSTHSAVPQDMPAYIDSFGVQGKSK